VLAVKFYFLKLEEFNSMKGIRV